MHFLTHHSLHAPKTQFIFFGVQKLLVFSSNKLAKRKWKHNWKDWEITSTTKQKHIQNPGGKLLGYFGAATSSLLVAMETQSHVNQFSFLSFFFLIYSLLSDWFGRCCHNNQQILNFTVDLKRDKTLNVERMDFFEVVVVGPDFVWICY